MNPISTPENFVFHEMIDAAWIDGLYGDDYDCVREIFISTVDSIEEELPVITGCFDTGDLNQLRRTIHKIKPIFGFAGLLTHQEMMEAFEGACLSAESTTALQKHYMTLMKGIDNAKQILREDISRLAHYLQ